MTALHFRPTFSLDYCGPQPKAEEFPAGENPLCRWNDYFARADADWTDFPPIASLSRNHHRLANIAFRLSQECPDGVCHLPLANLAALFYGCAFPRTMRRIARLRRDLVDREVLIPVEDDGFRFRERGA